MSLQDCDALKQHLQSLTISHLGESASTFSVGRGCHRLGRERARTSGSRFRTPRFGANGSVLVSSGFRVMYIRRGPFDRRARLTHRVLQLRSRAVILMRFIFGVIFRFTFSMSTARTPEVSFTPLLGTSSSAWLVLRSWCQISATCCWWWTRCSLSARSCRRLLQALWESELLFLCAQWNVDHHI